MRKRGTAWRIMFEPINARLASSCSKKGINEAAIEAICVGDTSISDTSSGATTGKSAFKRAFTRERTNVPSSFNGALPCAIIWPSSTSAVKYSIPFSERSTFPSTTLRYGVSINPKSLIFAYTQREEIRPMLGPSGVSIGQRRP